MVTRQREMGTSELEVICKTLFLSVPSGMIWMIISLATYYISL